MLSVHCLSWSLLHRELSVITLPLSLSLSLNDDEITFLAPDDVLRSVQGSGHGKYCPDRVEGTRDWLASAFFLSDLSLIISPITTNDKMINNDPRVMIMIISQPKKLSTASDLVPLSSILSPPNNPSIGTQTQVLL